MASATLERSVSALATLEDLLEQLGHDSPRRILMQPPAGAATEQDLLERLESSEKVLCELVDGTLVEKAMGTRESFLAGEIIYRLRHYLSTHDLGFLLAADGPVRLAESVRLPNVSFVSWKNVGDRSIPNDPILDIVPTLVIEVLSESNTTAEIERKLHEYFVAGVKVAWIVDPEGESATVWTSRSRNRKLTKADALDGGKVLPGFKLPLAELFARTRPRNK